MRACSLSLSLSKKSEVGQLELGTHFAMCCLQPPRPFRLPRGSASSFPPGAGEEAPEPPRARPEHPLIHRPKLSDSTNLISFQALSATLGPPFTHPPLTHTHLLRTHACSCPYSSHSGNNLRTEGTGQRSAGSLRHAGLGGGWSRES